MRKLAYACVSPIFHGVRRYAEAREVTHMVVTGGFAITEVVAAFTLHVPTAHAALHISFATWEITIMKITERAHMLAHDVAREVRDVENAVESEIGRI